MVDGDTIVAFTKNQAVRVQLMKITKDELAERNYHYSLQRTKDSILIEKFDTTKDKFLRERALAKATAINDNIIKEAMRGAIKDSGEDLRRSRTGNNILLGSTLVLFITTVLFGIF